MHRVADKNLAIAVTGKVRGPQQARRDARREHLPIPSPVILLGDGARVFSLEHLADALLDQLERLPIPARGHGVPVLAVLFVNIGIPASAAYPFDQRRRDAIALDR